MVFIIYFQSIDMIHMLMIKLLLDVFSRTKQANNGFLFVCHCRWQNHHVSQTDKRKNVSPQVWIVQPFITFKTAIDIHSTPSHFMHNCFLVPHDGWWIFSLYLILFLNGQTYNLYDYLPHRIWPKTGILGPFGPMPDQKNNSNKLPRWFFGYVVTNFYLLR